jgi:hypothetical protein
VDATRESHIYQVENETQFIRNGDSSFWRNFDLDKMNESHYHA